MANPWERDWGQPTAGAPWERDWGAKRRPVIAAAPEIEVDDGEAGVIDRLKDIGIDVARGVVGLGETAVGMGDLLTGNLIGKGLAKIGYDPERTREILSSGYSQERAQENADVQAAEGFLDAILANIQNPAVALGTIVESSPMLLGSAAVIRSAAMRMLAAQGLKAGTAEAAAFLSTPAVRARLALLGSGAEGAMAAGSIQEQARQQGRDYTQSVLPAIAGGAGTAIIGQAASRIPGLGDIETAVGTAGMGRGANLSIGKRIARGMFQEGVLEELPQSTQEQIFSNLALGKPWDEGVPESAATGLVAGSGMGALVRAAERRRPERSAQNRIAVDETPRPAPGSEIPPVEFNRDLQFTTSPLEPAQKPGAEIPAVEMPRRESTLSVIDEAAKAREAEALKRQQEIEAAFTERERSKEIRSDAVREAGYSRMLDEQREQELQMADIISRYMEPTPNPAMRDALLKAYLRKAIDREAESPAPTPQKSEVAPVPQAGLPKQRILVRRNGKPFGTREAAESSYVMRENPGATVVPIGSGFGIQPGAPKVSQPVTASAPPIPNQQAAAELPPPDTAVAEKAPPAEVATQIVVEPEAGAQAAAQDGGGWSNTSAKDSSWVIRNKDSGEVVMETFDRKKVDALNTAKYEAVPIQQHLAEINRTGTQQYDLARFPTKTAAEAPASGSKPASEPIRREAIAAPAGASASQASRAGAETDALDSFAAQSKTIDQLKSYARGRFGRDRMQELEPEIQAAWGRKKDKPLMSQDEGGRSTPDVARIESAIAEPMKKLNQESGVDVVVLRSVDDAPESLRKKTDPKKPPRAAYHDGLVYLFADRLPNDLAARVALAHELVGHKGILERATPEEWRGITRTIDELRETNKTAKEIWAETERRYSGESDDTKRKEFLAVAAEKRVLRTKMEGLWQQVRAMLRRIFKSLGFQVMPDAELEIILANSEKYLREPGEAMQAPNETLASQSAQTDTPEFRRWFGDSKVVDAEGAPLVVYHGTNSDISEFKPGADGGIHFGTSKQAGMRVAGAGKNLMPVYLAVKNPRRSKDLGGKWKAKIASAKSAGHDGIVYLNRYEGVSIETIQRAAREGVDLDRLTDEQFREFVPEASDSYIAFRPEQIKSAIGNNGEFDPNNPSILFSQAEPESEFLDENRLIREEDKTLWNRAKRELKRQLTPAGLLPAEVFKAKIARDNKLQVVEFDIAHLVGELERAIKHDYGVNASELSEADQEKLSEALAGKMPNLPETTKEAVIKMRAHIDEMSKQYIQILGEQINAMRSDLDPAERELLAAFRNMIAEDSTKKRNQILDEAKDRARELWGDGKKMQESLAKVGTLAERISLMETIAANDGKYVHRSYQAFDNPNWFKKIPDKVLNDARSYLMDRLIEDGETEADARRQARVILEDIIKEGTAYDSMEAFIRESKLGAKDLSVLKKRKQIAPEIRALLGEYKDPRINYAKSATKMGRLIWNQRFLDRVREVGMGSFLFTEDDRPPNTTPIAAEGSEIYAPLNGLYAPREVVQAFKDALGKEQMADWYRTLVQINSSIKFGKTILSPTTAMRNWQSAMFFALANGHFDMRHAAKAVSGLKEYFTHAGSGEKLKYLRKLKDLGVVYDVPYAQEMMRLLDDTNAERFIKGSGPSMQLREALNLAQKFYSYGDDFWKLIGFENEKRMLMDYAGMSESDAEIEAAERIRNTYPTYSMIGRGIQSLRRFPLVGTFVSFPAEIIRTSFNMLKYIQKDLQNEKTRPMAYRKIAGLAMVSGFGYALQALSKTLTDMDEDDEEAVRIQAAPWQQNSNLIFTGRDEKGNIRYIDISFLDPYNYFKRPINAMMRDQPWQDEAVSAARDMLSPFFGPDILAGSVFAVLANKTSTGGQVYKESDSPERQLADITEHLVSDLQPGITSNLYRTWKAIRGESTRSGQKYNAKDELAGWLGWRATTLDPKVALYYRAFDFGDEKTDATRTLNEVLTNPNKVTPNQIANAYELTVKMRKQAYENMSRMVSAARKSGMSDSDIREVLKASSVSQTDIRALLRGEVPEWSPTSQSERAAIRRATAIMGADKAAEIRNRYREARRISRE